MCQTSSQLLASLLILAATSVASGEAAAAQQIPVTASPALEQAWQGYYTALDEMRRKMEATPRFQHNPQDRAKAYHTLMEMQAMAYNFVVAPRMTHPRIYKNLSWQTNIYTLGQNGPDFIYGNIFLDGAQIYRLTGRLGAVKLLLIQIFNGLEGDPGFKTTADYDLANMQVGAEGRFEIILGGPKRPGNWIPLDPKVGYQHVFIRRALADWSDDPGELEIARISAIERGHYDGDEFEEAAMAARIHRAENFIRYCTEVYNIGLYDMYLTGAKGERNRMSLLPGTVTSQVGSTFSNYAMAIFHLADDEALLIELPKVPDGVYWSFQTGDVWSRSLDFNERQTSINMAKAQVDADGGIRIVVSKQDPGVANWLDTAGRIEGTIVFRNYRAKTLAVPASRVAKLVELPAILPQGTAKVTPGERQAALNARRRGFRKLLGE